MFSSIEVMCGAYFFLLVLLSFASRAFRLTNASGELGYDRVMLVLIAFLGALVISLIWRQTLGNEGNIGPVEFLVTAVTLGLIIFSLVSAARLYLFSLGKFDREKLEYSCPRDGFKTGKWLDLKFHEYRVLGEGHVFRFNDGTEIILSPSLQGYGELITLVKEMGITEGKH